MKKIIRLFFLLIVLSSFSVSAQIVEYYEDEELRILEAEKIEIDIENFISNNLFNYSLPQSKIDEIWDNLITEHDGCNHEINSSEFENLLIEVKKNELRELYFLDNPDNLSFFYATPLSDILKQQCVNGGFENGIASYNFRTLTVNPSTHIGDGCNAGVPSGAFVPTGLNLFQNSASLVNSGNEPLLATLGVIVNRVKSGNFSLKINPTPINPSTDGQIGNRTTVTRNFIINENSIDFSFLHIGSVVTNNTHSQPSFRYRLIDNVSNVVLRNVCIRMNNNDCRYVQRPDVRAGWAGTIISYTPQWVCQRINTNDLIGRDVRLEFMISDCDFRGHFSTVYIDDICGVTCPPTWGNINLEPLNLNCPTSSFSVCGSFQLPANSNLTTMVLNVVNQSGTIVGTINSPVITGSNFCFTVNPSVFGTNPVGDYTFQVVANMNSTCFVTPLTDSTGIVSFNNCCQPTLILNFPGDNISNVPTTNPLKLRKRSDWIRASNHITVGSNNIGDGVVYHADNFIELLPGSGASPGFEALLGSQFSAYIDPCASGFVYRNDNDSYNGDEKEVIVFEENSMDLIQNKVNIYPNPTSGMLNISLSNNKIKRIVLSSIEGKIYVFEQFDNSENVVLDLSNYSSGIYLMNIETDQGEIINSKVIKN